MFLRGTAAGIPKGWETRRFCPHEAKDGGDSTGFMHWREFWSLPGSVRLGVRVRWGRQTGMGGAREAAVSDAGLHVDGERKKNPFGGA